MKLDAESARIVAGGISFFMVVVIPVAFVGLMPRVVSWVLGQSGAEAQIDAEILRQRKDGWAPFWRRA